MYNNIREYFMVTERGVRKPGKHCPHSMAFPATMSALKTYLGLPPRNHIAQAHGCAWICDDDYYFQMGVSAEGFGMQYDIRQFLQEGKWENEELRDCFLSEGFQYHLAAVDSPDLRDQVLTHLSSDWPVIFIKEGIACACCELVIGYAGAGEKLLVYSGGKGVNISKNAKCHINWLNKVSTVIFIDGIIEPANRKDVFLRALKRAYGMLTETSSYFTGYGCGKHLWEKWIARLNDDDNYKYKSNRLKYITPEKFDLAERRCYAAEFFKQAEALFGEGTLTDAITAFLEIHDKMWEVHALVTDESGSKLLDRKTRDQIIEILKYGQSLDLKAAANIRQFLER